MERKFNTKLTEIKNIGDELRFQREYYNFKNSSKKLTPKIYKGRNSIYLGDKLKEFLNENFEYMQKESYDDENKGEYGANETMLYDIEHNKIRASKEKDCGKYNIDSYYLRIYSLFKIYGFLDDYEIIMLLYKYGVSPKFNQSKIEIDKIKERCFNDYKESPKKACFDFKHWQIFLSPRLFEENMQEFDELTITNPKTIDIIKTGRRHFDFSKLKKIVIQTFTELSSIERKCLSLELGKETNFIENLLKGNIKYITLETLQKIIDNIKELKNTDFEYIIKIKSEKNKIFMKKEKVYNRSEIETDIFDFRKKWGI